MQKNAAMSATNWMKSSHGPTSAMTNAVCCVEVSVSMRGRVFVCIGMGGCVDHACMYHYKLISVCRFRDGAATRFDRLRLQ